MKRRDRRKEVRGKGLIEKGREYKIVERGKGEEKREEGRFGEIWR